MAKTISIRWSLLRSFIALTLTLSVLLLISTLVIGRRATGRALLSYIREATAEAESEIAQLALPAANTLLSAKAAIESGRVNPDDLESMNRYLASVLPQIPQVTSVNIGDMDGNGYLLLEEAGGWRNRLVRPGQWGSGKVQWILWNDRLEKISEEIAPLDYDPRTRPWYTGAVSLEPPENIYWSPHYIFTTSGDPGISISLVVHPPNRSPLVLAFDMLLKDISAYTTRQRPSPNGKLFIMLQDRRMIGLPMDERFSDPESHKNYILEDVSKMEMPEITAAVEQWQRQGQPNEQMFRFEAHGQEWWCSFYRLPAKNVVPRWLCTIVPEKDIIGDTNLLVLLILIVTVIILLMSVVLSLALSRQYTAPIKELVDQGDALRRLDTRAKHSPVTSIEEILNLSDVNERMRVALDAFSRYIPIDVVRQLLDRGEAARLGGRNEKLTVMFSDIENFATVSEAMSPEALVQHIAPYFEAMLAELQQARATVDKFIGDSIMAFWGAPLEDPDHHVRAMQAVWQCRQAVEVLNARWKNRGALELRTRFGLAYGNAVVGNVGTTQRLNYTALGDTVNLASRLEGLNKYYGTQVLAAEPIPQLTGEGFIFRRVDVVAVKGRSGEVGIYELLGPAGEVSEAALRFKTEYEAAWDAYARRDFADALEILAKLASPWSNLLSVDRLINAAARYAQNPPPEDWRAVSVFEIK